MLMYVFWIVVLAALLGGIILLLHRSQQQNSREVADRSAPLSILDPDPRISAAGEPVPVFVPLSPATPGNGLAPGAAINPGPELLSETRPSSNWLAQVKRLREKQDPETALQVCREHFPRVQAFQQATVILRQQIRDLVEEHKPVREQLKQLYRIAVLADLYRNSNPHKPKDPLAAYATLERWDFDYQSHGTRLLRLLTKNDIRQLEQLWGRPQAHRHAEEVLGDHWLIHCSQATMERD